MKKRILFFFLLFAFLLPVVPVAALYQNMPVLVTDTTGLFHQPGCRYGQTGTSSTLDKAILSGYGPCYYCFVGPDLDELAEIEAEVRVEAERAAEDARIWAEREAAAAQMDAEFERRAQLLETRRAEDITKYVYSALFIIFAYAVCVSDFRPGGKIKPLGLWVSFLLFCIFTFLSFRVDTPRIGLYLTRLVGLGIAAYSGFVVGASRGAV